LLGSAKLSEATKKGYLGRVKQYLKEVEMTPDGLVQSAKAHPKQFEERFIEFIRKTNGASSASTTTAFRDSVKRFLEINRVDNVNWQYINEFVPAAKKAGEDRAPTREEVRRIIDVADLRTKCLVLFLCSSGSRIGSVRWLRWKDVEEVENVGQKFAKVTIYHGEPEEYTTFITPECYRLWLEYREWRENIGEKVTPSSFVFTTQGNARKFDQSKVKAIAVKTLKNQLGELLEHLGMREVISEREGYVNYSFKQAHGFRKFFKTRMEVAGVRPLVIETTMGHATGVSKSYYKPTSEELAEEYGKAIGELTVGEKQVEKVDIKEDMKKEILLHVAGFKQEEIEKLDISSISDEDFQKMVRERLMGAMIGNGNRQKVVPVGEVESHLLKGYDFVSLLPNDRAILKLPA